MASRNKRLQRRDDLQSRVSVEILLLQIEWEKVTPAGRLLSFHIFIFGVGVKKKQDACAGPVQGIHFRARVLVDRPHVKIVLKRVIMPLAEKRKKARHSFPFAARNFDEWPGSVPFLVLLIAIVDLGKKGPNDRCGIALRRALKGVEWQHCLLPVQVGAAVTAVHIEKNGPE